MMRNRPAVQGITIDPLGSIDLDDGISLEGDGTEFTLHVSIADVAEHVPISSPLLDKAKERCFSRYFIEGRHRPLWGPRIEEQATLSKEEGRPAITVSMPIRVHQGQLYLETPVIYETLFLNMARMDYAQVDSILASEEEQTFSTMLQRSYQVAQLLLKKRQAGGAFAFVDPEKKWILSEDGFPVVADENMFHLSHLIIQEFMILTNQSVAAFLAEQNVPTLFRNHTARTSAPNRQESLTDISNALIHPEHYNTATVLERLQLVFNRASYGPTTVGHYALNLPAYTHFTSPIRRLSDWYVLHNLRACLRNQEIPFTMADLQNAAYVINAVENAIKDERKVFYQRRESGITARAVRQADLQPIPSERFRKILQQVVQHPTCDAALEAEIIRRMAASELRAIDLYYLLFQAEGDDWQNVKHLILEVITQQPHFAASLFQLCSQLQGWELPRFEFSEEDANTHVPSFTSVAEIRIGENEYRSLPCSSSQKRHSEQSAQANLLAQIVGVETEGLMVATRASGTVSEAVVHVAFQEELGNPEENYKGILQETCQANGWPSPTYGTPERTGSPDSVVFSLTAKITIGEDTYVSDLGKGSRLLWAEQRAAKSLLEELPEPAKVDKKSIVSQSAPIKSSKATLQELCQGQGWGLPTYTQIGRSGTSNQPVFTVVAVVTVEDIQYSSDPSQGPRRRGAEEAAATSLLQKLQVLFSLWVEDSAPIIPMLDEENNYVAFLAETCSQWHLRTPVYEFRGGHGNTVSCRCTAWTQAPNSMPITDQASAPSRRDAQQKAAKIVCENLLGWLELLG